MKLVIADSMAKSMMLGSLARQVMPDDQWVSLPTRGFWRDFPKSSLGVDLKTLEPKFSIRDWNSLNKIITTAVEADAVYLATTDDWTGDVLAAWVRNQILDKYPEKILHRIRLSELTVEAFERAVKNPSSINPKDVEAYETKMVLDRLITSQLGEKFGPLAIGRAMIPVLKVMQGLGDCVTTRCYADFDNTVFVSDPLDMKTAMSMAKAMTDSPPSSARTDRQDVEEPPPLPFDTDSLIDTATEALRTKGVEVLSQARSLFETGFITQPTDAGQAMSQSFFFSVSQKIRKLIGDQYVGTYGFGTEGRDCVRPTDINRDPSEIPPPVRPLYRLIWSRTMAACSVPAKITEQVRSFEVESHTMTAKGSKIQFDGYRRLSVGLLTRLELSDDDGKFFGARVEDIGGLTEARLAQELRRVFPQHIHTASVVKALENHLYVGFHGMNISILGMGLGLLEQVQEHVPEMLWPEFLIESDARIAGVRSGLLSKREALVDYASWIESKL